MIQEDADSESKGREEEGTRTIVVQSFKRILWIVPVGVWAYISLSLIDLQLAVFSDFGFLFSGLVEGDWKPGRVLSLGWVTVLILWITVFAVGVEFALLLISRVAHMEAKIPHFGRALVLSLLIWDYAGIWAIGRYPLYSCVLLYIYISIYYLIVDWLKLPNRLVRAKYMLHDAVTFLRKPNLVSVTSLSPVITTSVLLELGIVAWNWERWLYSETILIATYVVLSMAMIVVFGVHTLAITRIAVKIIRKIAPSQHSELVRFSLYSILSLEVAIVYSVGLASYTYMACSAVVSYPLSVLLTKRIVSNGEQMPHRLVGLWSVTKRTLSAQRYNTGAFLLSMVLLCSLVTVPRDVIAYSQPSPEGVAVGIVDTGIETDDPYLRNSVVLKKSFVTIENGFSQNETDPEPLSTVISHGTIVAHCLRETYQNARIVSAKVSNSSGYISGDAIAQAISWCIETADVSVISISLNIDYFDTRETQWKELLDWAWHENVLVVVCAGNGHPWEGQGIYSTMGILGQSPYAITVGAASYSGPSWYSGRGPAVSGLSKPDIVADGQYDGFQGTSFAAPRVAGAAASMIEILESEGVSWTPGLVKSLLLNGATPLRSAQYETGAGLLNIENSEKLLEESPRDPSGVPQVLSILPTRTPLDFEYLYGGVNYSYPIQVFSSSVAQPLVSISDSIQDVVSFDIPTIDGYGLVNLTISPLNSSIDQFYEGYCNFSWEEVEASLRISFVSFVARATVGLVTCYNPWSYSSVYMNYSKLYRLLARSGIAVIEITDRDLVNTSYLSRFDGLVVLDPFTSTPSHGHVSVTVEEISALQHFSESGGGIIAAVERTNSTIFNQVFSWTNATLAQDRTYVMRYSRASHRILSGLENDFNDVIRIEPRVFNISHEWDAILRGKDFRQWVFDEKGTFNVTVLIEYPSRILFHGFGEWFTNQYIESEWHDSSDIVLRMCKWILGLY